MKVIFLEQPAHRPKPLFEIADLCYILIRHGEKNSRRQSSQARADGKKRSRKGTSVAADSIRQANQKSCTGEALKKVPNTCDSNISHPISRICEISGSLIVAKPIKKSCRGLALGKRRHVASFHRFLFASVKKSTLLLHGKKCLRH